MKRIHHVIQGRLYARECTIWHNLIVFTNTVGEWFYPDLPEWEYWCDVVWHQGKNKIAVPWPDMERWALPILAKQGVECQPWDIESCWQYEFPGCTMYETKYRDTENGIGHYTFDFHDENLGLLFKLEML